MMTKIESYVDAYDTIRFILREEGLELVLHTIIEEYGTDEILHYLGEDIVKHYLQDN